MSRTAMYSKLIFNMFLNLTYLFTHQDESNIHPGFSLMNFKEFSNLINFNKSNTSILMEFQNNTHCALPSDD